MERTVVFESDLLGKSVKLGLILIGLVAAAFVVSFFFEIPTSIRIVFGVIFVFTVVTQLVLRSLRKRFPYNTVVKFDGERPEAFILASGREGLISEIQNITLLESDKVKFLKIRVATGEFEDGDTRYEDALLYLTGREGQPMRLKTELPQLESVFTEATIREDVDGEFTTTDKLIKSVVSADTTIELLREHSI